MTDYEWRDHKKWDGSHDFGRTTCTIECPFCGWQTEAFVWSLAGSGKRCSNPKCRAVHGSFGKTRKAKPGCPKQPGIACQTPLVCSGGCQYDGDPIHPNRIP